MKNRNKAPDHLPREEILSMFHAMLVRAVAGQCIGWRERIRDARLGASVVACDPHLPPKICLPSLQQSGASAMDLCGLGWTFPDSERATLVPASLAGLKMFSFRSQRAMGDRLGLAVNMLISLNRSGW
jgi:hypothetical protein